MKFSYKKFHVRDSQDQPNVTTVWRPIIPVRLGYQGDTVRMEALVDSGADRCIFPEEIASLLNIPFHDTKKYSYQGITGDPAGGHIKRIDLELNGTSVESEIVFSTALGENHIGILGQKGFFNHFKITFDYQSRHIDVNR